MLYTRRDAGKIALATGFASGFASQLMGAGKPNSTIKGVDVGVITYSYRSMPDQSAEATLKYTVDSGISGTELMGGPVTDWAKRKGKWDGSPAATAAAAAAAATGSAPGRGGPGRGPAPSYPPVANMKTGYGNDQPAGQWNGQGCPVQAGRGGGAGGSGAPGGGGRGGPQTPEQKTAADADRKWRMGLSMDIFKELRKLYNDAGVSVYALNDLPSQGTDEDMEYTFTVAKTLGAKMVTGELPAGPTAPAILKRLGDTAAKHQMFATYHTHAQGSMTVFNDAFEVSKGNMAGIDFGHMIAGGDPHPIEFLNKFHDRTANFHLKDRTKMEHCALNLAWGNGETPIKELLQLVSKNKWPIHATIELEYTIPEGSDAVKETAKCLEFCKKALA